MMTDIQVLPEGLLILTGAENRTVSLRDLLCNREPVINGGSGYLYFSRLARDFAMILIRGEEEPDLSAYSGSLPPEMRGAVFVTQELLKTLFQKFCQESGGAEGIRALNPAWKDLGRVMFHLAENKQDSDGTKPFVFLATCQHKIGENGQIRHIPLGSALKTWADAPKTLLSYLEPVKAASADSPLLKRLLDDKKIFKPTFFSAMDAWEFLRDIEKYKAAGIGVRLAGLWNNGRPKRLKVDIGLDVTKKRGLLTSESLVRFSVGASLGDLKLTEAELAEILQTKGGLIRIKGEWVEAETERVKALLERWETARLFAGKSELSFLRALKLLSGARGLDPDEPPAMADDICAVNASPAFAEALCELTDPGKMQIPYLPDDLNNILRPYQKTGVAFLWNMLRAGFGVCMADDMGLGKTLQVITVLELFRLNGKLKDLPALAVVPASLLQNWMDECQKFTPGLRVGNLHPGALSEDEKLALDQDPEAYLRQFDLVLITYALVARRPYLTDLKFPLILLDEAQQIKNPSSGVSRAVRSLRGERRIAMTGTPVENSLSDLWSIFDFICPALLGTPAAFRAFVKRMDEVKPVPDYTPLRKLVRPFILHRLKTDKTIIADLPDKIERNERTALTPFQAKFYTRTVDRMKHDLAAADESRRNGVVLSYLLQFKQICNHPSQFSGNGEFATEKSGKMMRLKALAETIAQNGEKMLIFTQFREMTDILHDQLTEIFHRPGLILHGGVPVEQRARLVREFQTPGGPPFFVISLKAGGTGLNLTAATHVVHFDRWWNPAVENQATDRAFRIGQKKAVIVHKFVTPGTIEEKIEKLIAGKTFLAKSLLDQGAVRLLTEMNNEELMNFVKLDLNAVEEE